MTDNLHETHSEIIKRLRRAEGHLHKVIGMIEEGRPCLSRAAAGGLGLLIGDGALSYREEKILETFYSIGLANWASLTFDYQFISNPAYNAARGPVSILSMRIHAEF